MVNQHSEGTGGMDENKAKISISIDAALLRRVEAVAEARDEKLSATISRMLKSDIDNEEGFVRAMEDPVQRAIIRAMWKSPAVVKTLAAVVGEEMSSEQVQRVQSLLPKQVERGKAREADRKTGHRGGTKPAMG